MTAQSVAVGFTTASVLGLAAYVALRCQARGNAIREAVLQRYLRETREQLQEAHKALETYPGPDWWDREFAAITARYGRNGGTSA